jgi:hypothetical protein
MVTSARLVQVGWPHLIGIEGRAEGLDPRSTERPNDDGAVQYGDMTER